VVGAEGSLLFWSFLLSVYVFSVLLTYRNKNGEVDAVRRRGDGRRADFLLTLNNFVASRSKRSRRRERMR